MEALHIQSPYMSGTEPDLISLQDQEDEENLYTEGESDFNETEEIIVMGKNKGGYQSSNITSTPHYQEEQEDVIQRSRLNIEGLSINPIQSPVDDSFSTSRSRSSIHRRIDSSSSLLDNDDINLDDNINKGTPEHPNFKSLSRKGKNPENPIVFSQNTSTPDTVSTLRSTPLKSILKTPSVPIPSNPNTTITPSSPSPTPATITSTTTTTIAASSTTSSQPTKPTSIPMYTATTTVAPTNTTVTIAPTATATTTNTNTTIPLATTNYSRLFPQNTYSFPPIANATNNSNAQGSSSQGFLPTHPFSNPTTPSPFVANPNPYPNNPLPINPTPVNPLNFPTNNNNNISNASDQFLQRLLHGLDTMIQNRNNTPASTPASTQRKESRLVDFPEFRGGNEDPIEWLEAFDRACKANSISIDRRMDVVSSYLKGTALTWFNTSGAKVWENSLNANQSFVHLFKKQFCDPFKMSQWKHQLRNRKQRTGETVDEYTAAMEELWKRIDPKRRRTELDRISEYIEGLRPEFIVPVQSMMPETVAAAVNKAKATETAFSMGADLSAYSVAPGYLPNLYGAAVPAQTAHLALMSRAMASPSSSEDIDALVERKLKEHIEKALNRNTYNNTSNTNNNSYNNNNNRFQNKNKDKVCYNCQKKGHISRDCRKKKK